MRFARAYVLAFMSQLGAIPLLAQQATTPVVQRDAQAIAILQAGLRAMGGTVPTDSTATGSITITAGSLTSTGTIRILTKGTGETSEQIALPQSTTIAVFSGGQAEQTSNSARTSLSLERMSTSQSVYFPLPFLAAALANSDFSIQYIALEPFGQHIRLQNSFASQLLFRKYSEFAAFDVWLDPNTALPKRISYFRREASGAAPAIPVDTYFAAYQTVSGFAYPSQINVSFNCTPWAVVTISSVSFNTGLTDASFAIQ